MISSKRAMWDSSGKSPHDDLITVQPLKKSTAVNALPMLLVGRNRRVWTTSPLRTSKLAIRCFQ
jgi:hypothetical protein